jgi:hypothetical protein
MPQPDFEVMSPDGSFFLLVEAKYRENTSSSWAARLRRNFFAHGAEHSARPFLLVTPDKLFLWEHRDAPKLEEQLPDYEASAVEVLAPFTAALSQKAGLLGGAARTFEFAVSQWLSTLVSSENAPNDLPAPTQALLQANPITAIRGGIIRADPAL